jgi:hypothetical protein
MVLGEATVLGLKAAHSRVMLLALVLKARAQPLHNPLVHLFAKMQAGEERRKLLIKDFLTHVGLRAFSLVAGAVIVDVFALLDLSDHGAPAMAAGDEAREREAARSLAELPCSSVLKAELHALASPERKLIYESARRLRDLDGLDAGLGQQAIEVRNFRARSARCAVREYDALLRPSERYEKSSSRLRLIIGEAPPSGIIKADEDHCVIFQPFTLMNGHQGCRMESFILIQRL